MMCIHIAHSLNGIEVITETSHCTSTVDVGTVTNVKTHTDASEQHLCVRRYCVRACSVALFASPEMHSHQRAVHLHTNARLRWLTVLGTKHKGSCVCVFVCAYWRRSVGIPLCCLCLCLCLCHCVNKETMENSILIFRISTQS